jgi:hypothetical protein
MTEGVNDGCKQPDLSMVVSPLERERNTRRHRTRVEGPTFEDVLQRREADFDKSALPDSFPPPAPSLLLQENILCNFCVDLSPAKIEEAGCSVCGQLRLKIDLQQAEHAGVNLALLVNPGMTRKERFSLDNPICDIDGPIIDSVGLGVCSSCCASLKSGKIPTISLANGLWLGLIPDVLSCLTFAEKMMIARVRYTPAFVFLLFFFQLFFIPPRLCLATCRRTMMQMV